MTEKRPKPHEEAILRRSRTPTPTLTSTSTSTPTASTTSTSTPKRLDFATIRYEPWAVRLQEISRRRRQQQRRDHDETCNRHLGQQRQHDRQPHSSGSMSTKRELQLESASGKPCAKKCLSEIGPTKSGGGAAGQQTQLVEKNTEPPVGAVAVTITITEPSSSSGGGGVGGGGGPLSPSAATTPVSLTREPDLAEPADSTCSDPLHRPPQSPQLPQGASEGPSGPPSRTTTTTAEEITPHHQQQQQQHHHHHHNNNNNGSNSHEAGIASTQEGPADVQGPPEETAAGTTTTATATTTATDADAAAAADAPQAPDGTATNPAQKTCCFCWCCCCSCSCNNGNNMRSEHANSNSERHSDQQLSVHEIWGDHTPPPLDVILEWGASFDKLMRHPAGRKVFRDYLQCEYSEENILFWLACEELKEQTKEQEVEEKARLIYEDFISFLSPREVSLDSRARDIINKNMASGPTASAFDEAQMQIYTLMKRDSYPRFVASAIYKKISEMPPPPATSRKSSAA